MSKVSILHFSVTVSKENNYVGNAGAVQRKYESLRRMELLAEKENSDELLASMSKAKRCRSRRQRVSVHVVVCMHNPCSPESKYENRMSVVSENECGPWKEVDYRYMTEESDESSSAAVIVQHKLLWRSDCK